MGSSVSRPVSITPDPVGVAAALAPGPVGVAAALAPKDNYRIRPCSVQLDFLDVQYDGKVTRRTPESPIIKAELERIFNEMHQTKDNFTWRIPKQLVIAFVERVEMAHQYYDLKKYLRENCSFIMHDSNQVSIFDHIVEGKERNMFDKVGKEVIQDAIEDYIFDWKAEYEVKMKFDFMVHLKECKDVNWYNNLRLIFESQNFMEKFPDLSLEEMKRGLEKYRFWLSFFGPEEDEAYLKRVESDYHKELDRLHEAEMTAVDCYAAIHPVYALVLRKREEGCALDQNPEVELAKIFMSNSMYAHGFFMKGPMENLLYQARTVMVRNVPLNASKLDVKELFILFGDIEHLEMKSGDKYQTAYVTFEYPKGVDEALLLQRPSILDQPVSMKPMLRSEQREAVSAHIMSQDAKTDTSATKAEDARSLEEALWKYIALNRRYFPDYFTPVIYELDC